MSDRRTRRRGPWRPRAPARWPLVALTGLALLAACSEQDRRYLREGATMTPMPTSPFILMYLDATEPTRAEIHFKAMCKRAHRHSAHSQYAMGGYHRFGFRPVSRDLVQAHKWFTLALANGQEAAALNLEAIAAEMRPSDLKRAKALAADWQPDLDECE